VDTSTSKALQAPPKIRNPANAVNFWSVAAATLTLFYFVTSVYIASHRLFWYDEIFTVHVARLPGIATEWDALTHGVDSSPPGYFILATTAQKLFGASEVAARLPSALAMAAGLLVTFDCARRLTDGLHGLIALAVLTCSFLPYYGYEARSYAIYFMLAALSLWVWTCTPDDKRWSAMAFGAVLFLAVTSHYYAVLLLVPYGLWELYCWKPWQLPSPKLLAGLLGVALSIALVSKPMLSYSRQFSAAFWAVPTFDASRAIFSELFPNVLFLLVLVMVWIAVAPTSNESIGLDRRQAGESVGWLFLCIPLAGFVLARWKTNAFVDRYFISALPGIAVAFSCLLWRRFRNTYRVSLGVLLIFGVMGIAAQVRTTAHPDSVGPYHEQTLTRQYLGLEDALRSDGKRFTVFPGKDSLLHLEAAYYTKYPDDCILLLASDATQEGIAERIELRLARHYPLQFWTMDDLKRHALETALIAPWPDTLDALRLAGFQTSIRFKEPLRVVYLQR